MYTYNHTSMHICIHICNYTYTCAHIAYIRKTSTSKD